MLVHFKYHNSPSPIPHSGIPAAHVELLSFLFKRDIVLKVEIAMAIAMAMETGMPQALL